MNKDAEAINSFLAWLLQEPYSAIAPSGKEAGDEPGLHGSGVPQTPYVDPLESEDEGELLACLDASSTSLREDLTFFDVGERLAVQDRFFALIKRRLRAEIERNPPLFPWETDGYEYESEPSDWAASDLIPVHLWTTQLQNLNLPVPMSATLLAQLFERCQTVVLSSLREGAKLVQAVETLFPGQSPALNQLAGLVLTAPARGAATEMRKPPQGFPEHYDEATPAQQMLLSLLAARTMLETMTLKVSAKQPQVDRQWQTTAGLVSLRAIYQPQTGQVRVEAQLPCQGQMELYTQTAQSTAERSDAGPLSIDLLNLSPNQTYSLKIQLDNAEHDPLMFAVCPVVEH